MDGDGHITERGRTERELIEDSTDRLSARLLRPLAARDADTLLAALERPVRQILAADVLPFPNPIGLPRPTG